jgi:small subunit ribosomal protein S1
MRSEQENSSKQGSVSIMESLLANGPKLDLLKEQSIVNGTITEIRPDREVIVDIGGKAEGHIPIAEFSDVIDEIHVGETIEVFIERLDDGSGIPVLSYDKAQQTKNWENILKVCEEGCIASGKIQSKVKGGLIVKVLGVQAFLPSSQIDVVAPKNLDQYIGQTYDFKVIKINKERQNIVLSRRELIESQRTDKRQQILSSIKPGDICKGVIKNLTDYGAFVDLNGLDGLLYITDMTWGRISHPSEILKVGEEIDVMIIEIDREKERVSLGLKQLHKNPWENIESRYPQGATVRGKVVNLVPYGAFVQLEDGVEGLVHITEFSWTKRINKPGDVVKIGQELEAVVCEVNPVEQKISLSIRHLESNPWEMVKHNYPVGAHVRGKVQNLTNYGAFVELEEGIDGLVHVSDMSWTRKINHPSEILKKGDEIDAIVLDVDSDQQKISLGIKQLQQNPWDRIEQIFKIGDIVTGKVAKITSYGAFVGLDEDIDGLVHISQINEDRIEKIKDFLKVGQEVSARVIKIDRDAHRIGLSIKAASYDETQLQKEISSFNQLTSGQDFSNLGDILDQATQKVTPR